MLRVRALGAYLERSPGRVALSCSAATRTTCNSWSVATTCGSAAGTDLPYQDGRWWVRNLGPLPIQMADNRLLFTDEEPVPLPTCFTPLVVQGSPGREHLIEVHVSDGACGHRPWADEATRGPATWPLSPDERIALIVLGQRYLYQDPHPQPLTWQATTAQLAELQPDRQWRRAGRAPGAGGPAAALGEGRARADPRGGRRAGRRPLNHNLRVTLLRSTTLRPADVKVLDGKITRTSPFRRRAPRYEVTIRVAGPTAHEFVLPACTAC